MLPVFALLFCFFCEIPLTTPTTVREDYVVYPVTHKPHTHTHEFKEDLKDKDQEKRKFVLLDVFYL